MVAYTNARTERATTGEYQLTLDVGEFVRWVDSGIDNGCYITRVQIYALPSWFSTISMNSPLAADCFLVNGRWLVQTEIPEGVFSIEG